MKPPIESSHYKLTEKVNKMENELNILKELCEKQNQSLSTILHKDKKFHRSKSIDYTAVSNDNIKSKRLADQQLSLNKKFENLFRNTTPDAFSIENSQSQNALKFHINKLAVNHEQQYHSQEKVSKSSLNLNSFKAQT
jgi:septal ring factor EnvC (AmiA/AmiB activator)